MRRATIRLWAKNTTRVLVTICVVGSMPSASALAQPGRIFAPPPPPPPPPQIQRFTPPPTFTPPTFTPPPTFNSGAFQAQQSRIQSQQATMQNFTIQQNIQQTQRTADQIQQQNWAIQSVVDSANKRMQTGGGGGGGFGNGPGVKNGPMITISVLVANSQADQAGLRKNDIILSYDGENIVGVNQFWGMRKMEPAGGETREVSVLRNGEVLVFEIAPGFLGIGLVAR